MDLSFKELYNTNWILSELQERVREVGAYIMHLIQKT